MSSCVARSCSNLLKWSLINNLVTSWASGTSIRIRSRTFKQTRRWLVLNSSEGVVETIVEVSRFRISPTLSFESASRALPLSFAARTKIVFSRGWTITMLSRWAYIISLSLVRESTDWLSSQYFWKTCREVYGRPAFCFDSTSWMKSKLAKSSLTLSA